MTITDEEPVAPTRDEHDDDVAARRVDRPAPAAAATRSAAPDRPGLSPHARGLLAALSVGAGIIHLVMVPSHMGEWAAEGIAFALVGWFQLGVAAALVLRPSRALQHVAVAANAGFVAVWAVSRVWGLPAGPESGVAQPASFVDLTAVALEALFVLAAVALLVRPGLGARSGAAGLAAAAVGAVAALAVATAAVASPSAANHAHGGAAGGHHTDPAAAPGDGHDMAAMPGMDHGHGAGGAAGHQDHAQAERAFLFPDGDDKGWSELQNGEQHGEHIPDVPLAKWDPAARAEFERQMTLTVEVAKRYPTVADAEQAGYRRAGPFSPGLGAHYTGGRPDTDGVMSDDEIMRPTALIYDGVQPGSAVVGFMYASTLSAEALDSAGFAGPNDRWHKHGGVCMKAAADGKGADALGADGSITEAQCKAQGGSFMANIPLALTHLWTVPAYTSPLGVYSHLNPAITCPAGDYRSCRTP